jgi:hypothetical protein
MILVLMMAFFACAESFRTSGRQRFMAPSSLTRATRVNGGIKMTMDVPIDDLHSMVSALNGFHSDLLLSDEGATSGYSSLSLYFTLALYLLTLPGLYSLVTRSVKTKLVQKVYDLPGPANPTAKPTRQTAAEIMAYFKAMNYEVAAAEETITFKGVMGKSKSQAAFLTFVTFFALGSIGLVLSILLPDIGGKAYALTLLSPYAGIYYWNNAQRDEQVTIKMETSDDEQITSVIAQGGKEDLERFSKNLEFAERGKVYVRGIFENGVASERATESNKISVLPTESVSTAPSREEMSASEE